LGKAAKLITFYMPGTHTESGRMAERQPLHSNC